MEKAIIPTHPTWEEIYQCIDNITSEIKSTYKPDLIIGLARGGITPAQGISRNLNLPLMTFGYSSKIGKGDDTNHDNIIPVIDSSHINILVVDDICDSGLTLKEVVSKLEDMGKKVKTAVLYFKEFEEAEQLFIVDYKSYTIPYDFGWIVFPWEKE